MMIQSDKCIQKKKSNPIRKFSDIMETPVSDREKDVTTSAATNEDIEAPKLKLKPKLNE